MTTWILTQPYLGVLITFTGNTYIYWLGRYGDLQKGELDSAGRGWVPPSPLVPSQLGRHWQTELQNLIKVRRGIEASTIPSPLQYQNICRDLSKGLKAVSHVQCSSWPIPPGGSWPWEGFGEGLCSQTRWDRKPLALEEPLGCWWTGPLVRRSSSCSSEEPVCSQLRGRGLAPWSGGRGSTAWLGFPRDSSSVRQVWCAKALGEPRWMWFLNHLSQGQPFLSRWPPPLLLIWRRSGSRFLTSKSVTATSLYPSDIKMAGTCIKKQFANEEFHLGEAVQKKRTKDPNVGGWGRVVPKFYKSQQILLNSR